MKNFYFLLTFFLLLWHPLIGDELEGDLGGFDDAFGEEEIIEESPKKEESRFSLSGDFAFKTAYGYKAHRVKAFKTAKQGIDYNAIDQAQLALYLQLDTKIDDNWKLRVSADAFYDSIYELNAQNYNKDTLDAYKTQMRFDDVYIQGSLSKNVDLKLGRQIVVWGKSDSIRVTDVLNPLDNRLPAVTDIEDLRLPTSMAKLDYYSGKWDFSAMLIAESRVFLEAAPRSEFFPVDEVYPRSPEPFITLIKPDNSFNNLQYAFAANGVFSGWDLSFYGANVFDSKWYLEPTSFTREIKKITMIGSALNIVRGSWLFKTEIAYLNGVRYNSTQDEKDRLDTLIGFDYMGLKDTVLSLEVANKHIFEYESQMILRINAPDYVNEDELQTALRATRSFANDSINATALLSMFGHKWQYGGFARVWVEIELREALNANIGFVDYIDGDKPYANSISNNDRVFADITYSF